MLSLQHLECCVKWKMMSNMKSMRKNEKDYNVFIYMYMDILGRDYYAIKCCCSYIWIHVSMIIVKGVNIHFIFLYFWYTFLNISNKHTKSIPCFSFLALWESLKSHLNDDQVLFHFNLHFRNWYSCYVILRHSFSGIQTSFLQDSRQLRWNVILSFEQTQRTFLRLLLVLRNMSLNAI